jgi:hypothetical protein
VTGSRSCRTPGARHEDLAAVVGARDTRVPSTIARCLSTNPLATILSVPVRIDHLCLVAIAGCGRFGFTEHALVDGDRSDTNAACSFGPWSAPVAVTEVDSLLRDYGAQISADGLTLYFDSNRDGNEDLFVATRPTRTSLFGSPPPKLLELDTANPEDNASPRSDGLELVFHTGMCLMSTRRAATSAPWSAPTLTSLCGVNGAFIANGGLTLYYNSVVDLKFQGTLQVANRTSVQDDFAPGSPIAELAGGSAKGYPALSGDELTMYFESYSSGSNLDLFQVTRATKASAWGTPVAIDAVNTTADEVDASVTADGTELYFSSGISGNQHIYRSTRSCL